MSLSLTTEQQACLIYRNEHESRRGAKRYIRDHGGEGRAAELDAALAAARANPEAAKLAADMSSAVAEQERRAKHDREREEMMLTLSLRAHVVAAAADGDWPKVAELLIGHCTVCSGNEVADAWGSCSVEQLAEALAADEPTEQPNLEDWYEEISCHVTSKIDEIYEREAMKAVEAEAVKDGRYAVVTYYRKTLGVDSPSMDFDDLDTARAYRALLGDFSTSSYNCQILDTQEESEEADEEEEEEEVAGG